MSSSPQAVALSGARGITPVSPTSGIGAARPIGRTILMLHGGGQNRFSWNTGQILADEGTTSLRWTPAGPVTATALPAPIDVVET